MKDVADARPVVDLIWFNEDYINLFTAAGLRMVSCKKPLGRSEEHQEWVAETEIAPWVIYVLKK